VSFRLPFNNLSNVFCGLMILPDSPVACEFIPRFFAAVTPEENDQPDHHQLCDQTKTHAILFHGFLFLEMTRRNPCLLALETIKPFYFAHPHASMMLRHSPFDFLRELVQES
jgi:hypothetical protein